MRKENIFHISNRCFKLLKIIFMLKGTWWGGNPCILLCKDLVRGSMEMVPLSFHSIPFSHMAELNKIQYKALRFCIGLRRTTPTNVILPEVAESHLKRFKYLTSRYILKMFSLNSHIALDKLSELLWYCGNSRQKDPGEQFLLFNTFRELFKFKFKIADFDYSSLFRSI